MCMENLVEHYRSNDSILTHTVATESMDCFGNLISHILFCLISLFNYSWVLPLYTPMSALIMSYLPFVQLLNSLKITFGKNFGFADALLFTQVSIRWSHQRIILLEWWYIFQRCSPCSNRVCSRALTLNIIWDRPGCDWGRGRIWGEYC